jgi:hypothetical protein
MTKLGAALRAKYRTPQEALQKLGLDEALLRDTTENSPMKTNALVARALTVSALHSYLRPRMALDAKLDLTTPLTGVTGKNFKEKAPGILAALTKQTKGKLAKDAKIDALEDLLEMVSEAEAKEGTDESVSPEEHKAMEAAAAGQSEIGIPKAVGEEFAKKDAVGDAEPFKNFLKEKGVSDEDIEAAMDMLPKTGMDAEPDDEEKKKAEEAEEAEKAEDEKMEAETKAKDAAMKDMVSKPAMDAALKKHGDDVAKQVRATEQGIRAALETVRPLVGELPASMAFDSAEDVLRHAAVMLDIPDAKTIHASALPTVLKMHKGPERADDRREERIGMDAASMTSFDKMFPGASNIGTA